MENNFSDDSHSKSDALAKGAVDRNGGGQRAVETQSKNAAPTKSARRRQAEHEVLAHGAAAIGGGPSGHEDHTNIAAPTKIRRRPAKPEALGNDAEVIGRDGQRGHEALHLRAVPAKKIRRRPRTAETQHGPAAEKGGAGHAAIETQSTRAGTATIDSLDSQESAEAPVMNAVGRNGRDGQLIPETHLDGAVPAKKIRRRQGINGAQLVNAEADGGAVQQTGETQIRPAGTANSISLDSQSTLETQTEGAVERIGRDGRRICELHDEAAVPVELISELVMLWRRRRQWHRAEKSLTLQCSAICRSWCAGDKKEAAKMLARIEKDKALDSDMSAFVTTHALLEARAMIEPQRLAVEKTLRKLARELPAWEKWGADQKGFGELSLASIVGEAGDLSNYATVSKLWKRMGLAVIDGERQRKVTSKEDALKHGYNPARRSVVWNIGECLIKAQREDDDPWRAVYLREKDKQAANEHPPWLAHKRAARYMTKTFLASLWGAWNGRGVLLLAETQSTRAAPAE